MCKSRKVYEHIVEYKCFTGYVIIVVLVQARVNIPGILDRSFRSGIAASSYSTGAEIQVCNLSYYSHFLALM